MYVLCLVFCFYQQRINKIKGDTSKVSQPLYKKPPTHPPCLLIILQENICIKIKTLVHGLANYNRKKPTSSFAICTSTFHSSIPTFSTLFSFSVAYLSIFRMHKFSSLHQNSFRPNL